MSYISLFISTAVVAFTASDTCLGNVAKVGRVVLDNITEYNFVISSQMIADLDLTRLWHMAMATQPGLSQPKNASDFAMLQR